MIRLAILTISDAGARGERTDGSGDVIAEWAAQRGHSVVERALVPDELGPMAEHLRRWADTGAADLVLTTGGTGLTAGISPPRPPGRCWRRKPPESRRRSA